MKKISLNFILAAFILGICLASPLTTKAALTSNKLQIKADNEIARRISALNELHTKIQVMKKISSSIRNSFTSTIQGQINALNGLKAKIDADTDTTVLKTDIQSITDNYRIFALVLPQVNILAAADKLASTTNLLSTFEAKLQTRINTDQAAGQNTTSLTTSMANISAKITDANNQTQLVITSVSALKPDNGDKEVLATNKAALKTARTQLAQAVQDLKTAYKDALNVRSGLKKIEKTATSTAKIIPSTLTE